MKLFAFNVCMDESKNVYGLQLILSKNAYNESMENSTTIALDPIGTMEGLNCIKGVKLESPIVKVKAQYSETLHLVSGFKFWFEDDEDDELQVGWERIEDPVFGEDQMSWRFNQSLPLIGLYGHQSDRGIEKLGFITLDTTKE